MLLNDFDIVFKCDTKEMISPCTPDLISSRNKKKIVSYGVSSFGYDARLASEVKKFKKGQVIDVKNNHIELENLEVYKHEDGSKYVILEPKTFVLAHTIEEFNIPENVMAICQGKSTYARAGVFVNVTPLEPEWCGQVTLEIFNSTENEVKLYVDEGICQFIFLSGERPDTTYKDRNGKYQNQEGVTIFTC